MWLRVRGFSQKKELWERLKELFGFFFLMYFHVIYLFLFWAALCLRCCLWLSLASAVGLLSAAVLGLLIAGASLIVEHWPRRTYFSSCSAGLRSCGPQIRGAWAQ